jgi:hypothetical protein
MKIVEQHLKLSSPVPAAGTTGGCPNCNASAIVDQVIKQLNGTGPGGGAVGKTGPTGPKGPGELVMMNASCGVHCTGCNQLCCCLGFSHPPLDTCL